MSDETIVEMHRKITKAYIEEKKKLVGTRVAAVEFIRKGGNWINRRIETKIFARIPDGSFIRNVKKVYYAVYDLCQNFLDKLRLKLLGLK
jgi:hypothetical protein